MTLNEKLRMPKGYFKIEMIKNGEVIDKFEEHNLVMRNARLQFMKILSGSFTSMKYINKFALGTQGVYEETQTLASGKTQILQHDELPKDKGDGFNDTRTDLFCGTTNSANEGVTYGYLKFTPSGTTETSAVQSIDHHTGNGNDCAVNIYVNENVDEPTLTYVFDIGSSSLNGTGSNYIKYNEAGLFIDDELIAMRTFASKAKDAQTAMKITWSITF